MKTIDDNGALIEAAIRAGLEAVARFEAMPSGEQQAMIDGTPRREIPRGGLRPKRRQTETPLELEQVEKKEPKLF